MQARYDAVVIGSGFGGAVSACRLAQAGQKVAILERGRRYDGERAFPRDFRHAFSAGWLWPEEQGLVDVRPVSEMQVVQAAGYGGGSLIYANVHLRPVPEVFARGWPTGYGRPELDPYYDLVAYMLDIRPITDAPLGLPPKTLRMQEVAARLERKEQLCYPNLAVRFEKPKEELKNRFGVMQRGCDYCGECVIGCNLRAKNTLDFNYLAVAESQGAEVTTRCEVFNIEPLSAGAGGGYRVYFRDHAAGGEGTVEGRRVFLCAGALNSTELLLRCRDVYGSLPDLGDRLGERYSGNGDLLAFAFETDKPFQPERGPTITTGLVYDRGQGDGKVWFCFEEGGFPKELADVVQLLNPKEGFLAEAADLLRHEIADAFERQAQQRVGTDGGHPNTAIFLVMGRDRGNGRVTLSRFDQRLCLKWDIDTNRPLSDVEERMVRDVAGALGGKVAFDPFWRRLHLPVSVHSLGGCVMGDAPELGVTDGNGQVFGYPDLYVLDGAILPAATGVNPSHTIAAVAERNVEAVIRRIKGDQTWRAPEAAQAPPIVDPVSRVVIPQGGTMPPNSPSIGLSFTETMKGFMYRGFNPPDGYSQAERAAQKEHRTCEFTLTITATDLDEFLNEKAHAALAKGVLRWEGFTPPEGAQVSNGVFNLFVETEDFYERKMLYTLPFIGSDGKPYLLDGFKEVKDHGHFDVWGATSTLYTVIRQGQEKTSPVVATGIIRVHLRDFLHQLTTFQVSGARNESERLDAIGRFGKMFLGNLWELFVQHRLTPTKH